MKKLFKIILQVSCVAMIGMLSLGCAYTAPTAYFTLESYRQASDSQMAPVIIIGSVSVPEYLDYKLLAVRQGPNRLERREFDHWAEPLEDAIGRVLRDSLSKAFPKGRALLSGATRRDVSRDFTLHVVVYGFEPDTKGKVTFRGRWELEGRNPRDFAITVQPRSEPSVDQMVGGMSQAVDLLADEVFREITGR